MTVVGCLIVCTLICFILTDFPFVGFSSMSLWPVVVELRTTHTSSYPFDFWFSERRGRGLGPADRSYSERSCVEDSPVVGIEVPEQGSLYYRLIFPKKLVTPE